MKMYQAQEIGGFEMSCNANDKKGGFEMSCNANDKI